MQDAHLELLQDVLLLILKPLRPPFREAHPRSDAPHRDDAQSLDDCGRAEGSRDVLEVRCSGHVTARVLDL